MNKEHLFEVINEKVESNRLYYNSRIQTAEKWGKEQKALVERLEELEAEPQFGDSYVIFELESSEEASEVVAKLLELLPEIEKFHKVMTQAYSDNPKWQWSAEIGEITININPTEKPTDCDLIQKVNVSKSWSCQKKGGEQR